MAYCSLAHPAHQLPYCPTYPVGLPLRTQLPCTDQTHLHALPSLGVHLALHKCVQQRVGHGLHVGENNGRRLGKIMQARLCAP